MKSAKTHAWNLVTFNPLKDRKTQNLLERTYNIYLGAIKKKGHHNPEGSSEKR